MDASGSIYVTGFFWMSADFDPGPAAYNLSSVIYADIFILKLDNSGNFEWARSMGGGASEQGNAIAVDADANIYIAGYFGATVDFDPGTATFNMTSAAAWDAFVMKLQNCGAPPQPLNLTAQPNTSYCSGNPGTTLSVSGFGTLPGSHHRFNPDSS